MLKPNREIQLWQFFTVDTDGRTCLVTEKRCKMPRRTKIWKELQEHLEKPHIESVGFQTEDYDPLD